MRSLRCLVLAATLATTSASAVYALPDLSLAKSHIGSFVVGTNGAYTLAIANVGLTTTQAGATVVDTLPAGLTFVSGSGSGWTFGVSGQIVTCTKELPLAAGDTSRCDLTVVVGPAALPGVTNVATASTVGDSNGANDRATDFTAVVAVDLAIDKSHAGDFTVASSGTYTLTVTNPGTAPTFGTITVVDTLPVGLTYVSGNGAGWSCSASGQVVTCTHTGPLASGGSSVITLTVAVGNPAVPAVVNRAHIATAGDLVAANDVDSDPTTVNGLPDLAIDKSHTGNFIVTTNDTYTLVIANVGSASTAGSIAVVDTLPNGLTFVSGAGAGWSFSALGQVVTCTRAAPLAVGDTSGIELTVNVGLAAFPAVTNSAVVGAGGDPNPGNDRDTDPTTVVSGPDLSIHKSHQGIFTVGIDGLYTISVANIGSATTTGTSIVNDALPAGLTFVSANGPGWTCTELLGVVTCTNSGPINPGDSTLIALTVGVLPAAVPSVTNIASVAGAADVEPNNDADADPTLVTPVNLALAKSHTGDFTAGTNGVYTLTVSNVGVGPSGGVVTVRDTLPAGLGFVSGSGTGWSSSASGQIVTCTNATPLAAGASTAITLTVSVGGAAAPAVTNRATVSGGNDGTPANNTASDPTTVLANDLTLSKSHSGNFTVAVNGTYSFTVTNVGTASTYNVITVVDTLPVGLTFVSGSGPGWSFSATGQVVTCSNSGPIAPGASSPFALTVSVGNPAVPAVTNRACVTTAGDPNVANDCASDPNTVISAPDLTVNKTHNGNFTVGSNGTYTITVTNVGSAATSGAITVTDTLPAGLTFVSGSGAGWSFSVTGQVVTALHLAP
ncbi:MAG: hypothetical protein ABIS67_14025, partial [Candidatus Eisenbacteria bacterium]